MHPVEDYLKSLNEIHGTRGGTKEQSYYGPFETLMNEVGRTLKPKVRAVSQLRDIGAGVPDFGLYTANQYQRSGDTPEVDKIPPERGVVEVKAWDDDSFATSEKAQVSKYWERYGLVLVTNYRDFVLVGRDHDGKPVRLDTYRMAKDEAAFLAQMAHPRKTAAEQGERLLDFLRRALLAEAALTDPEDLAWFLASFARDARYRIEEKRDLPALAGLKNALEVALGMTFEGDKGEHFFEATLVQTLFYGVFSSWVLWSRDHTGRPDDRFDWKNAAWTLHVPMVASLFNQIATPQKLKPLGVDEVLDRVGITLNRVDRAAFFSKFEEEHAVQYFYEPFLKAYDPELRKELGVWYTPPEIVQYQVERVDRVLREELGIADGLADDNVVILDPCCGTGAYLVETLKRIHKTLEEKGGSALTAQKLKRAAMERVFGFEILPAPYVVSHLQLGLMLRLLDAPLDHDTDQRVGVYLTNALTGWEPLEDPKTLLPFPELMEERDAANKVKQESPIIVIMGNPPYNGFAGTAIEEERDLVTAYRTTKRAPKPEGQGLNDLYVRFYRMAERRIVEKSGRGVVCYISNYSWLEGLSHTGMREHYLEVFDKMWIDNLHGDRIISEYAPDGKTSETVFAMGGQSPGIKIGTAIALLQKSPDSTRKSEAKIHYRDFDQARAAARREALMKSAFKRRGYSPIKPDAAIGFPFKPAVVDAHYLEWPRLPDLFPVSFPGVKTSRDEFLVDIDRDALEERIDTYFNPAIPHEEIALRWPSVMEKRGRYNAREIREYLIRRGRSQGEIIRYAYRPFDVRWLYWEPETKLLDEKRSEYVPHVFPGNTSLVSQQKPRRDWSRPQFTSAVGCLDLFDRGSTCFPVRVRNGNGERDLLSDQEPPSHPNLSKHAKTYLQQFGVEEDTVTYHGLAVLHASVYAVANAGGIRQDWPRIPLPATKDALLASAALGRRVAALLDTEKPAEGVTAGQFDTWLLKLGVISKVGGGGLNPDAGELDLTAGWGHAGARGVCMPGRGKLVTRKVKDPEQKKHFGDTTLDIYLNDVAYWANVPKPVWNYHIGGYQVIKKWLSYREKSMLGRGLKMEETDYLTEMVHRIAALILLQPELDANYQAVKADTYDWPSA